MQILLCRDWETIFERSESGGVPTMASSLNQLGVAEWFAGRSVLVTGASGFLGGVLVEKLLRGCPKISTIYVLMRQKNKQPLAERLKHLLSKPLFANHTEESLTKVVAISGDIAEPDMAIASEDRMLLIDQISVVFHCAATVNFSAALQSAISINLLGTQQVLILCKEIKQLEVLVYVSTAYCNCTRTDLIKEAVYPSPVDLRQVIREHGDADFTGHPTEGSLEGHPNTYSFSKLLAENLLLNERDGIPIAVVRPSVVLGTWQEPFQGWVDNVNNGGALAVVAGACTGVFRTLHASKHLVADLVPCDHVVNLAISAAWSVARCPPELRVFHCTSGLSNPITWGQYISLVEASVRAHPCENMLWYPAIKCRSNPIRSSLVISMFHIWPAKALGLLSRVVRKTKAQQALPFPLLSIQSKYSRGVEFVRYFTTHQWRFDTTNVRKLREEMTDADRSAFDFQVENVSWLVFVERNVLGMRQFYHKLSSKSLPTAQKVIRRFKLYQFLVQLSVFLSFTGLTSALFGDISSAVLSSAALSLFLAWL